MRNILAAALAAALPLSAFAASAMIKNAKGEQVGTATLTQGKGGVALAVKVEKLPPGEHGIHIHSVGKCEGPDFKSAGAHLNPTGKKHGAKNPAGHHEGDLPNLMVGADGKGSLETTIAGAVLGTEPGQLLAGEGTSVVIHADADDMKTDPAGNSGVRIACGVIKP
jgi:Cu-Zn family superoxide dismutase